LLLILVVDVVVAVVVVVVVVALEGIHFDMFFICPIRYSF
jgi:hypothetical protein